MDRTQIEATVLDMVNKAKAAARVIGAMPAALKNTILLEVGEALIAQQAFILAENAKDMAAAEQKGISAAMLNRLQISEKGIKDMVQGLREVAALEDPVGEVSEMRRRPSGITVGRMRVPLGVILMIYESRPNVTIDSAALCLKAGNAVILRGGSEAINSNLALAKVLQEVLAKHAVDPAIVQVLSFTDREGIDCLLQQEEYIDLVIPRGGEGLIRAVTEKSRIPVLKHYKGVCHCFVDEDADQEMAIRVILNAKVQRPGVCNALEGLLVHREIANEFLPKVATALKEAGVRILGCHRSCLLCDEMIEPAGESDWGTEFLDLALVVRVVADLDEAMDYIDRYGSKHTEIILTRSYERSQRFLREVDASAVMVNASTRFNDGGQFGLGAEIGISTTKLHAYGPMGLKELTTRKFIVYGAGETRA
ncbi:glutamate-5-semialdehyde dehydrogenase [Desulfobulbus propionicus DSM 2032]|uniref:Gamma-glutamyl phosphate reductase n=1 Tax=Desulfobulbus propionicus (strain ATCC 33891 / DSM 2032 / VKM B-1956 / 1pr3) TaxID=577650 RepID=A0A7U3YL38_DESPD|nr:glutamate-5-semialdehyde dehydrogenase [Desulfobulbus propionicus]ADW17258.1 glutamate-5-semialdehyde dehydrogenase [Desulfobulbus propionicus DSM 2032]